jgi:hypothetical protein
LPSIMNVVLVTDQKRRFQGFAFVDFETCWVTERRNQSSWGTCETTSGDDTTQGQNLSVFHNAYPGAGTQLGQSQSLSSWELTSSVGQFYPLCRKVSIILMLTLIVCMEKFSVLMFPEKHHSVFCS